jgi:hypothetical protein
LFTVAQNASNSVAHNLPDSGWKTLLLFIALPLGIIATVCSILYTLRLSEAFGKGKLFCVGLLVIYPIFIAILGFGRSRYVAPIRESQVNDVMEDAESKEEVV